MKLKALWLLGLLTIAPCASAADCIASTYAQVVACIASNTTVKIAADIQLAAGEVINIENKSGVVLDGYYNGTNHVISESSARYQADTGHYIVVKNSSGSTIKNLTFSSAYATLSDCANPGTRHVDQETNSCSAPLFLWLSNNLLVDNCSFTVVKKFQIQIRSVQDSWITNSSFSQAATYGIWMFSPLDEAVNENVNIYGNYFTQIGANAIMLADIDGSWVGGNEFVDNHILTQYDNMGGGQVVVEQANRNSSDINVTGNTFTATTVTHSSGFELAAFDNGTSLTNLNIQFNRFEGNDADSITIGNTLTSNAIYGSNIRDNEFVNNYRTYKSQSITKAAKGVRLDNNYVSSSAAEGISSFAGTANTCSILPGNSHCSVDIKWDVASLSGGNLRVTVRSASSADAGKSQRYNFSAGINSDGQQSAPWIDATGSIFELYYESDYAQTDGWEAPVASITVKGI